MNFLRTPRDVRSTASVPVIGFKALRLVGFITMTAIAGGLAITAPLRAEPVEQVALRLDWWPGANHLPIFLAAARGYYKDAGIDLDIRDGKGSVVTIQAVTSGSDLIGMASLSTMTLAAAKGAPLLAIAGIVQRSPDAVIALKGSGIAKPSDVEGKRWGVVPDASFARSFPAFAAANNIDISKITRVQVSSATLYQTLLHGDVDFITGWASNDALKIEKFKPIEPPIVFADYGVNSLGTGIIVTRETAAKRGDLLRRFLAVTARGAAEVEKDPAAALAALAQARPTVDVAVIKDELRLLPDFLHTKSSRGHGYGWMASEDWALTRELLVKYYELPAATDVGALYTNEFLASP